jgi:hypothetical protein
MQRQRPLDRDLHAVTSLQVVVVSLFDLSNLIISNF